MYMYILKVKLIGTREGREGRKKFMYMYEYTHKVYL